MTIEQQLVLCVVYKKSTCRVNIHAMDYLFARQVTPAEQNNLFGLKKSRNLLHTRKIVQKEDGSFLGDTFVRKIYQLHDSVLK